MLSPELMATIQIEKKKKKGFNHDRDDCTYVHNFHFWSWKRYPDNEEDDGPHPARGERPWTTSPGQLGSEDTTFEA